MRGGRRRAGWAMARGRAKDGVYKWGGGSALRQRPQKPERARICIPNQFALFPFGQSATRFGFAASPFRRRLFHLAADLRPAPSRLVPAEQQLSHPHRPICLFFADAYKDGVLLHVLSPPSSSLRCMTRREQPVGRDWQGWRYPRCVISLISSSSRSAPTTRLRSCSSPALLPRPPRVFRPRPRIRPVKPAHCRVRRARPSPSATSPAPAEQAHPRDHAPRHAQCTHSRFSCLLYRRMSDCPRALRVFDACTTPCPPRGSFEPQRFATTAPAPFRLAISLSVLPSATPAPWSPLSLGVCR
ncbi:hypothetical protein OH77DRAFT_1140187 [Trametes cingulata]|nr:hypothetical protein OH77DRAFT_1140187 [Trametes cingulata]